MSRQRFVNVVTEFCRMAGLSDPIAVIRGGPVQALGVSFALLHDDRIDPGLVAIFCEVGPEPPIDDSAAYRALLTANAEPHKSKEGTGAFVLCPETGKVLLVHHESLDRLTATALGDSLAALARQVNTWRDDHPRAAAATHSPSWPADSAKGATLAMLTLRGDKRAQPVS